MIKFHTHIEHSNRAKEKPPDRFKSSHIWQPWGCWVVTKKEVEEAVETPVADVATDDVAKEDDGKIRKKQIYDHVTVATGLRKREVRESVDATLAYFHQVLSEGHDLQIPPLGKIRAIERGEGENAKMIYKVQLQKPKH